MAFFSQLIGLSALNVSESGGVEQFMQISNVTQIKVHLEVLDFISACRFHLYRNWALTITHQIRSIHIAHYSKKATCSCSHIRSL